MKKLYFLKMFISIFFLFSFSISFLFSSLMVSPQSVIFDSDDKDKIKTVKLIHKGNKKTTYRIKLIQYKQLPSGAFEKTTEPAKNEFFANDVVRFSPKTVTLYPREEVSREENKSSYQIIRVGKYFKPDTKDGEYRSHLLIVPVRAEDDMDTANAKEGLSIKIKTLVGVSIPVIVRKGNLTANVSIDNIEVKKDEKGQAIIDFNINRKGTKSVRGDVIVTLKDEKIGLIKELAVYLSTNTRKVSLPLYQDVNTGKPLPFKKIKGKKINIEYKQIKNNKNIKWANKVYVVPKK